MMNKTFGKKLLIIIGASIISGCLSVKDNRLLQFSSRYPHYEKEYSFVSRMNSFQFLVPSKTSTDKSMFLAINDFRHPKSEMFRSFVMGNSGIGHFVNSLSKEGIDRADEKFNNYRFVNWFSTGNMNDIIKPKPLWKIIHPRMINDIVVDEKRFPIQDVERVGDNSFVFLGSNIVVIRDSLFYLNNNPKFLTQKNGFSVGYDGSLIYVDSTGDKRIGNLRMKNIDFDQVNSNYFLEKSRSMIPATLGPYRTDSIIDHRYLGKIKGEHVFFNMLKVNNSTFKSYFEFIGQQDARVQFISPINNDSTKDDVDIRMFDSMIFDVEQQKIAMVKPIKNPLEHDELIYYSLDGKKTLVNIDRVTDFSSFDDKYWSKLHAWDKDCFVWLEYHPEFTKGGKDFTRNFNNFLMPEQKSFLERPYKSLWSEYEIDLLKSDSIIDRRIFGLVDYSIPLPVYGMNMFNEYRINWLTKKGKVLFEYDLYCINRLDYISSSTTSDGHLLISALLVMPRKMFSLQFTGHDIYTYSGADYTGTIGYEYTGYGCMNQYMINVTHKAQIPTIINIHPNQYLVDKELSKNKLVKISLVKEESDEIVWKYIISNNNDKLITEIICISSEICKGHLQDTTYYSTIMKELNLTNEYYLITINGCLSIFDPGLDLIMFNDGTKIIVEGLNNVKAMELSLSKFLELQYGKDKNKTLFIN